MEDKNIIELNADQALIVLINAVKIGQEHGSYSLEEAEVISKAVKFFISNISMPEGPQQSEC